MKILLIYLLFINLVSFIVMGFDKSQARNKKRRIPEKRLFTMALIGGSLGSWISIYVFHHKSKHMSFIIGIPLILIIHIIIVSYFILK